MSALEIPIVHVVMIQQITQCTSKASVNNYSHLKIVNTISNRQMQQLVYIVYRYALCCIHVHVTLLASGQMHRHMID